MELHGVKVFTGTCRKYPKPCQICKKRIPIGATMYMRHRRDDLSIRVFDRRTKFYCSEGCLVMLGLGETDGPRK